jgi:hypothetical protein
MYTRLDFSIPVSDRWNGVSQTFRLKPLSAYVTHVQIFPFFLFFFPLVGLRTQSFNLHEQSQ